MQKPHFPRTPTLLITIGLCTIVTTVAATAANHRLALSPTSGSEGSEAILQTSPTQSAIQAEVGSSANTSIKIPFAALGEYDAPGSTFGIGVAGISTTGYGVAAESLNSNPAAIALNTSTGDGLDAFSSSAEAPAIYGQATGGNAPAIEGFIDSKTPSGIAVLAENVGEFGMAVTGIDASSSSGESSAGFFSSATGEGVVAASASGMGGSQIGGAALQLEAGTQGTDLVQSLVPDGRGIYHETMRLTFPSAQAPSSDLQLSGNIFISGALYTGCANSPVSSATDCTPGTISAQQTSRGAALQTYGARDAESTIEDQGEARLVNGGAHVSLDPKFASTMSMQKPYLVFTTPQADSDGLYVSHRTPEGFDVRENRGGRSNLTFDYRIVAHPFGDNSERLADVTVKKTTSTVRLTGSDHFTATLARLRALQRRSHAPRQLVDTAPLRTAR